MAEKEMNTQAEPPPAGEFTKYIREQAQNAKERVGMPCYGWMYKMLFKACDRLDIQQQEIERMTVVLNNLKSANRTFASENKVQAEQIKAKDKIINELNARLYSIGGQC